MTETSITLFGDLSKPATTLIEKSSNAVGGLFRPWQIKRVARAESEAAAIRAEAEIQISEQQSHAFVRFLSEEEKKQTNMESILLKAILHIDDQQAKPEDIAQDWFANFFDKCRIVSDEQMQQLWARILAGEANNPGQFSRRTVNLMADIDQKDAIFFSTLCRFNWRFSTATFNHPVPFIFDTHNPVYVQNQLTFECLTHLESLGLIHYAEPSGNLFRSQSSHVNLSYGNSSITITSSNAPPVAVKTGKVRLTQSGEELSTIFQPSPIKGFFGYVCQQIKRQSLSIISLNQS